MNFEAIDCRTGKTLGEARGLPVDQLSQLSYEPEEKRLVSWGGEHSWVVEFGGEVRLPGADSDSIGFSLPGLKSGEIAVR